MQMLTLPMVFAHLYMAVATAMNVNVLSGIRDKGSNVYVYTPTLYSFNV
jgi:hypothetical protein